MSPEQLKLAQWQAEVHQINSTNRPLSARSQHSMQPRNLPNDCWQHQPQDASRPTTATSQQFNNGTAFSNGSFMASTSSRPVSAKSNIAQYLNSPPNATTSSLSSHGGSDFYMKPGQPGYVDVQEVGSEVPTRAPSERRRPKKAPDFVLNGEGWFQFYDPLGCGIDKADLAEAVKTTWRNSTPEFCNTVVRKVWPPGQQRMTLQDFSEGGAKQKLFSYMGEPPLKTGKDDKEDKEPTTPRSKANPTGSGKKIYCGKDPHGKLEQKTLPLGIVGIQLEDGPNASEIKDNIPTAVQHLLEEKGALPLYTLLVDTMMQTLEGDNKKWKWKADYLKPVVSKARVQFEKKSINIFICQAQDGSGDKIFKWIELIDRKVLPLYRSPDRICEGSEACAVM